MLDKSTIIKTMNDNNTVGEINQRLVFMMNLIKLNVYNEESSVDKSIINHEIDENSTIIRDYFDKNGFKKVFPFS